MASSVPLFYGGGVETLRHAYGTGPCMVKYPSHRSKQCVCYEQALRRLPYKPCEELLITQAKRRFSTVHAGLLGQEKYKSLG